MGAEALVHVAHRSASAASEARDWLYDSVGSIYIAAYTPTLSVDTAAIIMTECQVVPVTATITDCNGPLANLPITFSLSDTTACAITGPNDGPIPTVTDSAGTATVYIHPDSTGTTETTVLSVSASPHEIFLSDNVNITINPPDILTVTVNPFWIVSGGSATVTATLMTGGSPSEPVPNAQLVLTTDQGSFSPHDSGNQQQVHGVHQFGGPGNHHDNGQRGGNHGARHRHVHPDQRLPRQRRRHVQDRHSGHEDPL